MSQNSTSLRYRGVASAFCGSGMSSRRSFRGGEDVVGPCAAACVTERVRCCERADVRFARECHRVSMVLPPGFVAVSVTVTRVHRGARGILIDLNFERVVLVPSRRGDRQP